MRSNITYPRMFANSTSSAWVLNLSSSIVCHHLDMNEQFCNFQFLLLGKKRVHVSRWGWEMKIYKKKWFNCNFEAIGNVVFVIRHHSWSLWSSVIANFQRSRSLRVLFYWNVLVNFISTPAHKLFCRWLVAPHSTVFHVRFHRVQIN